MDENEYKSVCQELIAAPCYFEKSILALKTQCTKATKKNIAERQIVMCESAIYADRCDAWLSILRRKSQFSLHSAEQAVVLPHGKEMKVQVGGMLGLCDLLTIKMSESSQVPNVYDVLELCDERFTGFESLPFSEIIREVVHFRLR